MDYYEVVSDLFVERFMLPIREWGRRHGVKSSGHVDGEDQPWAAFRYGHGNLMKTLRAMDAPGVDVIWRQLFPGRGQGMEGRQAPFPRYAKSAANQIGSRDVLSESFGIYGASLTPGEMKWLVDYQALRGVSMFTFAYYAMSYSGQWMTLFEPQSGPASPYWDFQEPYFRYVHRVSSLLAEGDVATDIAVFFDARAFFAGGFDAEFAARQHEAAAALLDRFRARLDGYGSAVYLVNTKMPAEPAEPEFDLGPTHSERCFAIKTGWTLTRESRYFAGSNRLERVAERGGTIRLDALGDWREHFGWHFSGIATYENEFEWTGEEGEFLLDLGSVAWTCRATFNGERLSDRFFGPFAWRVRPKKGRNRLVVTVAGNLAPALSDDETRARIHRDHFFPGIRNYEERQMAFDRANNEGGLLGPVLLRPPLGPRKP